MDRRNFLKTGTLAGMACLCDWHSAFARGTHDALAGKPWQGWKPGQLQIHFIYTGVGESAFYIMPDGTTMLLDCGDHNAIGRGKLAVPVLPSPDRHSGEWITRYVQRVNPNGNQVDYMMLSHYHNDHGGCQKFYAAKDVRDGEDYFLSGFSQAAETLTFDKAFDRCWPTMDDPIPLFDKSADCVGQMTRFYNYMQRHRDLKIEKFRVGETNQIALLRKPAKYRNFSIRNLCGNGRIAAPDGQIIDLYAEKKKENPTVLNENGMSLGFILTYGNFRFYTAGDFSDTIKLSDGRKIVIEDALAEVCGPVNVAKVNHHGHYSMPEKLVSALRAQVYVSCVWDQLHNVSPVMERLASRDLYPGNRIICPGIMPAERRAEDAGKAWLSDVSNASFEGGHVVLCVEKGGKRYSVSYLTAADESMTVRSVMRFKA
ncbi:MAG: MBL fold metallo-hydrolase [Bacteroidaceae bacterium]|nr:MBL fold metallo-hydrolase [Bacteroidaceae bacterium]